MDLPPKGYKRNLVLIAYAVVITVGAYIFIKFLLAPLLPFIIAYTVALFLRPTVDRICLRTHIPKKVAAFGTVAFVFTVIFALSWIFFGRMASELSDMTRGLTDGGADFIENMIRSGDGVMKKIPILSKIENQKALEIVKQATANMLEGALSSFSAKIPDAIMCFVSSLPGILLFLITLVVSTFYLAADIASLNRFAVRLVPREKRHRIFKIKKKLMRAVRKYVKAYAIILLITGVQLFIGFMILKIPYALTLSVLIALIDILPVLGVGTVLVPWSIVLYMMGNSYTATGLLIIFGIIWLVRQVSEPKIVGESVGVSPLITLLSMYIGFKLIGFSGLFIFPIGAIIAKSVYDAVRDKE
ncbi:MAG: sporulation integral membrane protein YtvI [Clostridia bacterium]|nr:sporulation integral membrane protein YtvI [Clostridia bacterium]